MAAFKRTYKVGGKKKKSENWYCEYFIEKKRFCEVIPDSVDLSKKAANTFCRQLKREATERLKIPLTKEPILFSEAANAYYDAYFERLNKRRAATHKILRDAYKHIHTRLKKVFRDRTLLDLTQSEIILNAITLRRKKGIKEETIRNEVNFISGVYTYALALQEIKYKEVPNFKAIRKLLHESSPRKRYLNESEYDTLMRACSDEIKPILIFAVETGMRREEYLSLRWQDVDLVNRRISVRHTKNGRDRNIPISQAAFEILQELLTKNKDLGSIYVFCKSNGTRFYDFKKSFYQALKDSGTKDLVVHDLRRTFGSWRLQGIRGAKLDIFQVSILLGHSDVRVTQKVYAFLDELKITL